jgi:transketolase
VEHYAALRAIPNLVVIRPGDANEVVYAWREAIDRRGGPTAILLSRQNMPTLDRSVYAPADRLRRGAYVLADLGEGDPQLILMATGSEVGLIVAAGEKLAAEGVSVRLVSFPSWELFEAQEEDYQKSVLLPGVKSRLAVEAGVRQGWRDYVGDHGDVISLEHFGASAPYQAIFENFGYTVENVLAHARKILEG